MAESTLVSSCQKKLGPVMKTLGMLQELEIIEKDEILIPKIVVIGDQSSGKTSLIESLMGLTLPHGLDMCTKLPLVVKFEDGPYGKMKIELDYEGRSEAIENESLTAAAIEKATSDLTGETKDIGTQVLTLSVKKKGFMGLTIMDLPGLIRRLPTADQPHDTYSRIKGLTNEEISSDKLVFILNVVDSQADFEASESTCMARDVDPTGKKTLSVLTKCDRSNEKLHVKVLGTSLNYGHGWACVINRINDGGFEEARSLEKKLFKKHPLSQIPGCNVGVGALAERIGEILCVMVLEKYQDLGRKVEESLKVCLLEQKTLEPKLATDDDDMATFTYVVGHVKETLDNMLVRGEIVYIKDEELNCNRELHKMLKELSDKLTKHTQGSGPFLQNEIDALRQPHATQDTAFQYLLERKVDSIMDLPKSFVEQVWTYIRHVSVKVVDKHCPVGHQKMRSTINRTSKAVIKSAKDKFLQRVRDLMEREKSRDQSIDFDYMELYKNIMPGELDAFLKQLDDNCSYFYRSNLGSFVSIEHLSIIEEQQRHMAFKLNLKITMHWKIILMRIVDWIGMDLRFAIQTMITKELQHALIEKVIVRSGVNLKEDIKDQTDRRESLQQKINLLQLSKRSIEQFMEGLSGIK